MRGMDINSISLPYVKANHQAGASTVLPDANNTQLETGIYHCHSNTKGLPEELGGLDLTGSNLIHLRFNVEASQQIYLTRGKVGMYVRSLIGSNPNQYWLPWEKVEFEKT